MQSTLSIAMFVVMQCLGSGAFYLPMALTPMGSSAYIAWILSALGAISIGLIFVKLASNTTVLADVVSQTLPYPSTVSTIIFIIYLISAIVGNLLLLDVALSGMMGVGSFTASEAMWIIFIILFFLNLFPESSGINFILSVLKVVVMLGIPLAAICFCEKVDVPQIPTTIDFLPVLKAMPITLFAFIGIESVMNGRIQARQAQRGIVIGCFLCLLIYLLNTYVTFNYVPDLLRYKIADQSIVRDLAPRLLLPFNLFLVFIGVTNINSWNLSLATSLYEKYKHTAAIKRMERDFQINKASMLIFFVPLLSAISSYFINIEYWWKIVVLLAIFIAAIMFHCQKACISKGFELLILATTITLKGLSDSLTTDFAIKLVSLCSFLTGIIYLLGLIGFVRRRFKLFSFDVVLFSLGLVFVCTCLFTSAQEWMFKSSLIVK